MRIDIVFDPSYSGDDRPGLVEVLWLVASDRNRLYANLLNHDERAAPAILLFEDDGACSGLQRFVTLFRDVESRYPGWSKIVVHGLAPDPSGLLDILMPGGEPSGVFVSDVNGNDIDHPRFALTKDPPRPPSDRVEIWRDNLPPKGLLTLTDAAVRRISELRSHLLSEEPGKNWIPALSWGQRNTFDEGANRWRELPDGFTLGFFPNPGDFPPEAIEKCCGIEIIFRLGFSYRRFENKIVDYRKESGGFVLET